MNRLLQYIGLTVIILFTIQCTKDEIDYADGNPSILVGNWIAFHNKADTVGSSWSSYEMVTSLDPNNINALIIDNLFQDGVRVRANIDSINMFSVTYADQINYFGSDEYRYITLDAQVSSDNPSVRSAVYNLALGTYPDLRFNEDEITETMVMHAAGYQEDGTIIDSALIFAYRRTGFEVEAGF